MSEENKEEVKDVEEKVKNEEHHKGKCKEELQKKQEELEELTDRYKRVMAEFENYKKRSSKERENLYGSILGDVVEAVLPVLENAAKVETKDENYKQGVELVLKQFKDVLKSKGVEEIEAIGTTFDPELHEAVSSVQDESKESQEIVQEYRKGYKFGNKVIRHSMVVVAN